jgi:succinate dehydrogenase/fumarate reductase flavoprotein subunit
VIVSLDKIGDDAAYDFVVGAGAGGLAAALFAAIAGKSVLLVERTEYVGGTTAFSAGTTWIPNTPHSASLNPGDTPESARRFLDGVVGNFAPASLREAFLEAGPKAVAMLEAQSDVKFRPYKLHPDYEQQVAGATLNGRALEPLPFDGRELGEAFNLVRQPTPAFTILGGMMVGHEPNLCVAPIAHAPFYAVKIAPGSLGTFAGLRTDAQARVLDGAGRPIEGLFAVGNDMSSMMGGRYPAGGITLGPAMIFGFVAAHIASGAPPDI